MASWPAPADARGGLVPLPWAGRERMLPLPSLPPVPQNKRWGRSRKQSMRKAKYAAAMVGGFVALGLAKRIINAIPIVNLVTRPVLDLFPTIIFGPALGAAALYGHEKGDPLAAREVVQEKAQALRREINTVARDVSAELAAQKKHLSRQLERHQDVIDSTARVAMRSVQEMEQTVVPALERGYRNIETHAQRTLSDIRDSRDGK
ncbi:hypothetical protein HXX76_003303 [Chlamydomonas incerta]|uniref:Uncharacterized protein n=1 Tax=Chlamydomonas incerta TaxID=51695 RepID=A0A835W6W9_CHLIN|nr:hypothetical protein HXX76_003303 [Chlamydomonas incerta]|eukprot:KAG2441685.1 hypothetical protein HXX76_003303 [Chlamydomonas incerta]